MAGASSHASAFRDGAQYEATLGPAHRYYIRVKARALERFVARRLPHASALVDLGCGTGEMEEALAHRPWRITGVDLSDAMVEHARAKGLSNATFVAADAASTGLPAGAFDVAFATSLFHHVPREGHGRLVAEMRRLVRPGGLVVVFEHNPANPVTRRMVRDCPVDRDAELVTRRRLVGAMRDQGLRVEAAPFLLFVPHALRALAPLDRALAWVPMGGQYAVVARRPPDGAGRP